ncbi:ricin B lectin domain-containing protein [Mycena alexandri]|uniref:Ricin B lectin domain-containing protein n=1 Tax=Mycena alexandri TaxID=1745969 RepID=A0AAD6XAE8_9AGAR|nr:ricin B lectin domain-containing protein [Mycena alexandri]
MMSMYLVSGILLIASGVWGNPTPEHPAARQAPLTNQYIHLTDNFEMCLAAEPSSDGNGAAVVIEYCVTGGNARQNWTISGSTLQVLGNMCLDVTGGATANGTPLQIWECTAGDVNQEWTLSGSSIQWSQESSCLDLTNGNATNGNVMQIWACTDGPNQQWTLTTGPSEPITPVVSSTTCLTAPTNANGGKVVVDACDGSTSQLWTAIDSTLVVYGNKCLDVTNGNTANGTKLQIWDCTPGDANQQLGFFPSDQNIQWASHGMCVDLTDGSLANGNQVQLITCYHDPDPNNQIWNFGIEYIYSG